MKLTGNLLIGAQEVAGTSGSMNALNPTSNVEIEPPFAFGGVEDVDHAAQLADDAFDSYSHTSLVERAEFLERIADGLDVITPELARRASLETGLPVARSQHSSFVSSRPSSVRGASVRRRSTLLNRIVSRAQEWTIACKKSHSVRSLFLARAISRFPIRSRAGTLRRRWLLAALSS